MVISLLNRNKVIIWPMKDGNGEGTFELGPIVTVSCHPWDSNAKNKTHHIPHDKTLRFHACLTSKPHGNPLQAQVAPNGWRAYPALALPPFVEPSQQDEPPIPGPSPSSKPPEEIPTCEPEPEVALTQSTEEPF
ncbi:hypothetical protein O181_091416, partial [Austropuccinia psidii MF-1]|nr:hypothetical protein [Austropuccinia psidii MF-1]